MRLKFDHYAKRLVLSDKYIYIIDLIYIFIYVYGLSRGETSKEPLINSEVPAAHGCVAIFDGGKPLKMKKSENHAFRFSCSENARMELFRASQSKSKKAQELVDLTVNLNERTDLSRGLCHVGFTRTAGAHLHLVNH